MEDQMGYLQRSDSANAFASLGNALAVLNNSNGTKFNLDEALQNYNRAADVITKYETPFLTDTIKGANGQRPELTETEKNLLGPGNYYGYSYDPYSFMGHPGNSGMAQKTAPFDWNEYLDNANKLNFNANLPKKYQAK
jgi:hypothetical protein